jgi:hypothetical protein
MTPPRFRLRTLLVAVAVAATALGAMGMVLRSAAYAARAARYDAMAHPDWVKFGDRNPIQEAAYRRHEAEEVRYYLGLKAKYERAAAHPWLPVAPDPPPPE